MSPIVVAIVFYVLGALGADMWHRIRRRRIAQARADAAWRKNLEKYRDPP